MIHEMNQTKQHTHVSHVSMDLFRGFGCVSTKTEVWCISVVG